MSSLLSLTDDLAAHLREERQRRDLTQPEAAEQVGVSLRTWQGWESGEAFPQARHRRALRSWLADEVAA